MSWGVPDRWREGGPRIRVAGRRARRPALPCPPFTFGRAGVEPVALVRAVGAALGRLVVGRAAQALRGLDVDGLEQRVAAPAARDGLAVLVHQHRGAGLEDRLVAHRAAIDERVVRHAGVLRERDRPELPDVPRHRADLRRDAEHPRPLLQAIGTGAQRADQQLAVAHQVRAGAAVGPGAHLHAVAPAHVGGLRERVLPGLGRLLEGDGLGVVATGFSESSAPQPATTDRPSRRATAKTDQGLLLAGNGSLAPEYPPDGGYRATPALSARRGRRWRPASPA